MQLVHANHTLFHPFNTAVVENRYWTARAMHALRSFLCTQRAGSMLNSIFRPSSLPCNWEFECLGTGLEEAFFIQAVCGVSPGFGSGPGPT